MTGLSSAGEANALAPLTSGAYLSLHTADPGDTGANEVSTVGTGYGRIAAGFTNSSTHNPTVASNASIASFLPASIAWGTITHFGVWTAASGGTFQGSGALTTPKAVSAGDTARFIAGAATITVQ